MIALRKILLCDYLYRFLVILALLFSLCVTKVKKYESKYDPDDTSFKCILKEYKISGDKLDLILKCKEKLKATYYIKSLDEKKYFESNLLIGSKVEVSGTLEEAKNNTLPYMFNYKKYLYNEKIYYLLKVDSIKFDSKNINIFYNLKNYLYKRAEGFQDKSYIYAFILGKTTYIDEEVVTSYRENGISHLFALSGLHVSIFSVLILFVLKRFRISELMSYIFVFIFLMMFSFITNFSPSILRASLLFFLLGINKVFYFNVKQVNVLYLVFSTLLIINPFIIYKISFILSFLAAFFLMVSSDLISDKGYLKGLFKVSLISFIGTMSISIYYFGYINLLGTVLNLVFVPFVSFIIFPFTLFTFVFPFASKVLYFFTDILEILSTFFNKFKIIIYFPKVSIWFVVIFVMTFAIFIKVRKKVLLLVLMLLLALVKVKPLFKTSTDIYYLDVGQGDSILLTSRYTKTNILIDTGGKTTYKKEEWAKEKTSSIVKSSTIPFMRKLGISKLNYLIITHGDYDHMGEAINLVNNFKVEKVIFNCGEFNDLEKKLIKVLDKKNTKYYSCIKELNIDDNKLYFLQTKEYDNENDNSNVIYTELNGYKFMFMGDAGVDKEKDIIEEYNLKNIDVLKVGHHGSKTSSSKYFINKIEPKYAIISVGMNNRYGHPNKEVLNNLEQSKIYRTDQDGSIMFKTKNNELKIETCNP
mgnify:FL=1